MGDAPTVRSLSDALQLLGRRPEDLARHPILHGAPGTLFALALPVPNAPVVWAGVWIAGSDATFLVPVEVPVRVSIAHGVSGPMARFVDLLAEAIRRYLEEAEQLDARLAAIQDRGLSAPGSQIWSLRRESAALQSWIARTLVIVGEAEGPFTRAFPGGSERALPSVIQELERVRELTAGIQQSLTDLILLRNAEESNRISQTANRLSEFSNRIAILTNTSNIRMLGITYVALLLGLVSAVVLVPNTAATILGMPSAAWVPGIWVDAILLVLIFVPIAVVFTRPWVRRMLRELRDSELRTAEGLHDLPELSTQPPGPAARRSGPEATREPSSERP